MNIEYLLFILDILFLTWESVPRGFSSVQQGWSAGSVKRGGARGAPQGTPCGSVGKVPSWEVIS